MYIYAVECLLLLHPLRACKESPLDLFLCMDLVPIKLSNNDDFFKFLNVIA